MRARIKRRRRLRNLTILAVLAIVALSLAVGFYVLMNSGSSLDNYIGKPIPSSFYSSLYQASVAPYGSYGSNIMNGVKSIGLSPYYTFDHKPILVYVGADYCLYCAVTRWSLVMALMRFGNFTGLEYMTSSRADGDYATFSFQSSSYQSNYVAFQAYELQDRNGGTIDTLPSNYTSSFSMYGHSSYPFLNFANNYYITGALVDPSILGTKDWTEIASEITAADSVGAQLKGDANVITATICRLTNGAPSSVCSQDPIRGLTLALSSYSSNGGQLLLGWEQTTTPTSPPSFPPLKQFPNLDDISGNPSP